MMPATCSAEMHEPAGRPETVVANIHRDKELIAQAKAEGRYVYIGRPPAGRPWEFGNPFSYKDDTKAMVITDNPIKAFRLWLLGEAHTALMQEERRWILKQLPSLKGYTLGCFCAPKRCHGDVLKELAESLDSDAINALIGEPPATPRQKRGEIRALTLWRPWPWLIVRPDVTDPDKRRQLYASGQGKAIENRSWKPPAGMIGQYIAIHAGKTLDDAIDDQWLTGRGVDATLPAETVHSAIVGVARLVGFAESEEGVPMVQRRWWFGPVAWLLADIVPIEPVPCRGKQGLWPLDEELLRLVRRRYRAAIGGGEGQ